MTRQIVCKTQAQYNAACANAEPGDIISADFESPVLPNLTRSGTPGKPIVLTTYTQGEDRER